MPLAAGLAKSKHGNFCQEKQKTSHAKGQKTGDPWGKLALGKEAILVNTEVVLTGVTLVTRYSAFANDSNSPDDLASYEVFFVIIATAFN